MGLAVQAGLLAAFIVVFLPLGMAGWHLTRIRLLFFSVALFITLAVSVHLSPYFPSITMIFSPLKPEWSIPDTLSINADSQSVCVSFLHDIDWEDGNFKEEDELYVRLNRNPSDPCAFNRTWFWGANVSMFCSFQKVNKTDTLQLLKGSWIMIAGDSQARLFLLALLDHVLNPSDFVRDELFKRHSNYTIRRHNIKFDFIWAPYVSNLTSLVTDLKHSHHNYPDVLIMGDALWHMLHVTNASSYAESLIKLQKAVFSLLPTSMYFNILPTGSISPRSASNLGLPKLFWMNMPRLANSLLNTEEKRVKLTSELSELYDGELRACKLLQPEGPLTLLDIYHLSKGCGVYCTADGMHYCGTVYEAAVQVMLNALLIATQQAPSK